MDGHVAGSGPTDGSAGADVTRADEPGGTVRPPSQSVAERAVQGDEERRAYELALARAQSRQRAEQRRRATWPAMITALLVVLGIVVALLLIVPRTSGVTQPPVDVAAGARAASLQVAFTPSVPMDLPTGWRATSVRTTPASGGVLTWHAGYLTPDEQYAALEQGKDAPRAWLKEQTRGGRVDGTMTVNGLVWDRYVTADGSTRSLVRTGGGNPAQPVTTVVTGTGTFADLAVLAGSLLPAG